MVAKWFNSLDTNSNFCSCDLFPNHLYLFFLHRPKWCKNGWSEMFEQGNSDLSWISSNGSWFNCHLWKGACQFLAFGSAFSIKFTHSLDSCLVLLCDQNSFGLTKLINDLDLTIMIWSRPKWNGQDQNHFGPTKTVLVTGGQGIRIESLKSDWDNNHWLLSINLWTKLNKYLAHRTLNFVNPEFFVYLLFEYFSR